MEKNERLQKAFLKIFEAILIPTGSIATYSMSAMFPGTKNRAQKITSKHWNACLYTGELTTNPSDPSEEAALTPCAAFFMSSRVLEPRNAAYQSVTLPCPYRNQAPVPAVSWWEGEASPGVGCGPVPAGCAGHTWGCGAASAHSQGTALLLRGQQRTALLSCQEGRTPRTDFQE